MTELLEPVAVIGMAGRFPGARDVTEFWNVLADGVECVRFPAEDELLAAGVARSALDHPDYVRAVALPDGLTDFDAGLFGFTPREATLCDPQIRLFLETAHAALEHAGYAPDRLDSVGVFGSAGVNRYHEFYGRSAAADELRSASGMSIGTLNNPDYVATLVSYKFGFRGPSMTVQTACSSSMVAAHLAAQALRSGECDIAVAGGADVELPLGHGHWWAPGSPLSRDGHCRPFDAGATGTVFGSGAGVVVLKLLSDALADGDEIHAVIRSSALNNDGSDKIGFSAPSVRGQAAAVVEAMAMGGFTPSDISYLEAHATGTELGDPVELEALNQAYRQLAANGMTPGSVPIASVKGNVGHLGHASGVTSLIKVALALRNELIPANANFTAPNPKLPLDGSPFVVNDRARPWPAGADRPRLAGINSLGIGGTNVHMVVGEPPAVAPPVADGRPRLVVWSARTPAALDAGRLALAGHFGVADHARFGDAVVTLQRGRTEHAERAAVVATDAVDAERVVRSWSAGPRSTVDSVGFLLPGQGSQHAGMAHELYDSDRTFRASFDECLDHLRANDVDVRARWLAADDAELADTGVAQPLLFAVEYSLAAMWRAWEVRPDWLLGHSIGELTAAAVAGVMTLPDAAAVVAGRARAMAAAEPGAMLAVRASADEVAVYLPDSGLSVAVTNGPRQVVLAGGEEQVEACAARLREGGIAVRRLRTSHAFHCDRMRAAEPAFLAAFAGIVLTPPRIPIVSAATGAPISDEQATDPMFWVGQLSRPVLFGPALDAALADRSALVVEVGPGRVLTDLVGDRAVCVPSLPAAAGGDWTSVLGAVGTVWSHGRSVDWEAIDQQRPPRRTVVPGYRYERQRHWLDPVTAPEVVAPQAVPVEASQPVEAAAPEFTLPTWIVADPVQGNDTEPGDTAVALLPSDPDSAVELMVALQRAGLRVVPLYESTEFRELPDGYQMGTDVDGDVARVFADLATRHVTVRLLVHALGAAGWETPSTRSVDGQVARSFHSLLSLVRQGHRHAQDGLPDVLAVTRNAVDVSGDEGADPVKATMHGAMLSLVEEEPRASYKIVDLGRTVDEDALVAELGTARRTEFVALRGARRWLRGLRPFAAAAGGDRALRRNGVYLITGGLGGLGRAVARELAGTGLRPTLLLLGRTAEAGAHEAEIEALERMGARVAVLRADVTDARGLRRTLDIATSRYGAVHGVFHLAGVPGDGMLHVRSAADVERVLAPKVKGTLVLAEALAARPVLDFFVVFSSRAALDGHRGSGDYAAANAFLDAFVATDALPGCRKISINWPAWNTVGMAAPAPAAGVVRWRTTLRPDSYPVLDEHRINGRALLPGTGHLDLIVRAYRDTVGDGVAVRVEDVVFQRPFVVHTALDWEIDFEPREGGGHSFQVCSRPPGEDRVVHVQGRIGACADTGETRDLDALRDRMPDSAPPPRRRPGRRMFLLGPRWSNVTVIRTGTQAPAEKLVSLALPEVFAAETAEHWLHPTLLDSATAHARDITDGFFLPFGYESVTVHGRIGPEVISHIRRRPGGDELIRADVEVLDPDGRLLVAVSGFTMRRVTDTAFADQEPAPEPDAEVAGIDPGVGAAMLLRLLDSRTPRQVSVSRHRGGRPVPEELALSVAPVAPAKVPDRPVAVAAPEPTAPEPVPQPPATAEQSSDGSLVGRVSAVFARSLGIPGVDTGDDFFQLGGNSLTAVEVMSQIRAEFAVDLSIAALFDYPTIGQLAEELQRRGVA